MRSCACTPHVPTYQDLCRQGQAVVSKRRAEDFEECFWQAVGTLQHHQLALPATKHFIICLADNIGKNLDYLLSLGGRAYRNHSQGTARRRTPHSSGFVSTYAYTSSWLYLQHSRNLDLAFKTNPVRPLHWILTMGILLSLSE